MAIRSSTSSVSYAQQHQRSRVLLPTCYSSSSGQRHHALCFSHPSTPCSGSTLQHAKVRSRKSHRMDVRVHSAEVSVETITAPFLWFNSAITYAWILLIAAPRWSVTQAIMKSDAVVIIPSLTFLYFFVSASMIDTASPEELGEKVVFLFTEAITDPVKMATLSTPAYIAQDWVHLLVWDFVVGRFIYLDALANNLPIRFSLLVTFNAGPAGLLVHLLTKAIVKAMSGKAVQEAVQQEAKEKVQEEA